MIIFTPVLDKFHNNTGNSHGAGPSLHAGRNNIILKHAHGGRVQEGALAEGQM